MISKRTPCSKVVQTSLNRSSEEDIKRFAKPSSSTIQIMSLIFFWILLCYHYLPMPFVTAF